jgi:hypothetical protein
MAAGFGANPPAPELSVSSSTFRLNGTTGGIATFGADVSLSATAIVRQFRNVLLGAAQTGKSCAPASFNADAGDVSFTTDDTCLAYVGGNLVTAQFGAGNSFGLQTPEFNGGPVLTLNLAPGSPAIDNGTNTGCPAFDARGVARPYDGDGNLVAICDVGAVEYVPNVILSDGFE